MIDRRTTTAMAIVAAIAIFGVICRPLLPIDETRYLAVAWEMHLSGNWLVPQLNGQIYTHKPPLLFWLVNVVWSVFGVSEFAARLVAPAFGVAAVGMTSLIARRLWPLEVERGGRAALILSCSAAFIGFAGLTMFDAMLTFSVTLGVYCLTFASQSLWAWIGLGAVMALGGFSKGPVVLLFLLPLALSVPFWSPVSLRKTALGTMLALVVGVALIALWLVPAIVTAGPDYRDAVLWKQHAGRVVDSFAHVKPWWFFLALLPLLTWPWTWSLAFWRRIAGLDYRDPGLRLATIWFAVPLVAFSLISGKQIHYLLPVFPAIILFLERKQADGGLYVPIAAVLPAAMGLGAILIGLHVVNIDRLDNLAQPRWLFAILGCILVVAAVLMVKWRTAGAHIAGPVLILVLNCMFLFGAPGITYDASAVGMALLAHDDKGVAVLDGSYAGEFNFTGRLTRPAKEISSLDEAMAWLRAVPGGALVGRLDRSHPDIPPEETFVFRDRPYGIWVGRADNAKTGG